MPFLPSQTFPGSDNRYQLIRSHTSPKDGCTSTPESNPPLSPYSTTLTLSIDDTLPSSAGDEMNSQVQTLLDLADDTGPKRTVTVSGARLLEAPGKEEPYASLIHRAFLSTLWRAMTLQEIYQWFCKNTNKGKDESKGWQNSIRHNLSMNKVGFYASTGTSAPLLSDPSLSIYTSPPSTTTTNTTPYSPFFHHPPLDNTTTTSTTIGLDYDYPSLLLYPTVPNMSMSARAASEATVDEP